MIRFMKDKHRINKILKALEEGTESVQRNPSDLNYRQQLDNLEKAGKSQNLWWNWAIISSLLLASFFLIYHVVIPLSHLVTKHRRKVPQTPSMIALNYCGDSTAGGTNIWYPVYITYSAANLKKVRQTVCCDAFYDPSVGLIQVASFYDRSRASRFVSQLKSRDFHTARVGSGNRITTSRSRPRNKCP